LDDKTQLPVSLYGRHIKSVIEDEDIAQYIHLNLQSLDKLYLCTRDIIQYLDKLAVKVRLGLKNMPSEHTAQCWMHTMEYQYGKPKNGMYMDSHECEDVVAYRTNISLPFWMSIESQMMKWDNDNAPVLPEGILAFSQQKHIMLVTHDESTFYANDHWKTCWIHKTEKVSLCEKGREAQSWCQISAHLIWGC